MWAALSGEYNWRVPESSRGDNGLLEAVEVLLLLARRCPNHLLFVSVIPHMNRIMSARRILANNGRKRVIGQEKLHEEANSVARVRAPIRSKLQCFADILGSRSG